MGKYYKTNTVPIVDYTVDYPFRDLMQAELYKQQRSDKTMDLLDAKRKSLLDMTAIPGTTITNADGTTSYQKSGDEQLLDAKREEYNSFVEGMRGKDLAKNYGAIRQGINDLYDPALADIQKSRTAYDAEQTSIDQMKAKGEWDKYGWANPAGWDSQGSGIYKGTASPFFDYRPNAEKIFDKAVENTYLDRTTGLLKEELTEDKLRDLAMRGAPSFMSNPKNHRAIDKYYDQLDPAKKANWIQSYGEEGAKKRAAQEMLFDVGMEKWSSQVKVPRKNQQGSTGSTASTSQQPAQQGQFVKFASTKLAEELSHDGTATVNLTDGGVDILINAPKSERKNGYYDVQGSDYDEAKPIILGNVGAQGQSVYFDYDPNTGLSTQKKVGDMSSYLTDENGNPRAITEDDVFYEQNQRRLKNEFEARTLNSDISMDDYRKESKRLQDLKREYADIMKAGGADDLVDFTDEDIATQESVMRAIKIAERSTLTTAPASLQSKSATRIYRMPDGTIKSFIGDTKTTVHGQDVTSVDYDAEKEFLKEAVGTNIDVDPRIGGGTLSDYGAIDVDSDEFKTLIQEKGIEILTPRQAKQVLTAQGNWAGDLELGVGNLKQDIDELDNSLQGDAKQYKSLLSEYRGRGLLAPDSDQAKASEAAYKTYLKENSAQDLSAAQLASLTGNEIFAGQNFDFKPRGQDNIVTIDGKLYMAGSARLTDSEVAQLLGGTGKEFDDGSVIEGTEGNPNPIGNFFSGVPGTTNIEQALVGAGLAKKIKWHDDDGNEQTGLEISTFMPVDFDAQTRQVYDQNNSPYTGSDYGKNQAANEEALQNIMRANKESQKLKRVRNYEASGRVNESRDLTQLANNILAQGPTDKAGLRKLAEKDPDAYFKLETDKQLMQEKVQGWKDYIEKAKSEDWGGVSFVTKELEPHLKVLEEFIAFPRALDAGGKNSVATAIRALSEAQPVLMDPMGTLTAGAQGATQSQLNTINQLQKQNYTQYKNNLMNRDLHTTVVPTMTASKAPNGSLLPTQALDDYKNIGVETAKMSNLTQITPTNTNIAINSSNTYIPYVAPARGGNPGFMSTLESIGKLGLNGLEISGALTLAPYERSLGVTGQSAAMTQGMGVSFGLDTPQKRKAADALKVAVAESEWGGTYAGKSIKIPAGYHLVANELGDPPRLQVTLEKD